MNLALLGMTDRVEHDVRDVFVGELVGNLATTTHTVNQVSATKNAEMLADQRLGEVQSFNELVDALLTVGELGHQSNPDRGGQGAEELRGLIEAIDGGALIHMQRLPYMHG